MNSQNNKRGTLMIILLAVVAVLVLFFPKIYDFVNYFSMPKVEKIETEKKEEVKKIDESVLDTIHYPLMRTSSYNSNTYYSLDKFTIKDLSNNDILLNGYLDIYEGNMTAYDGVGYCTNISKQFSKEYLQLRIKNIIGNNINYTFENFYVPEDLDSNYVGNWSYDAAKGRFIYIGLCESRATNTKYYDIEELIKVEYENKDIVVYYYVGFAKVEGDSYTIYSDAQMTKELKTGNFTNLENLNNEFKQINKNKKSIYKYTFKNTLCSYNEYCLYEGKWVNEL